MSVQTSGVSFASKAAEKGNLVSQILKPSFDENAIVQESEIPAAKGLKTKETVTLLFPNLDTLRAAITYPVPIDEAVVEKVIEKLTPMVGKLIYPSELARLLFELAFTDPEVKRLTPKQRTDNIGYVLSNLGIGNAQVIEKLYAFYYGYSFQYFSAPRE
ncbi:MAG: hypothetical protein JSS09_07015 [Verrucomicrobia bacterium]|nr:hypothetical protein [Verrucomicrobiota bacterium]